MKRNFAIISLLILGTLTGCQGLPGLIANASPTDTINQSAPAGTPSQVSSPEKLKVSFLDVGQGDATLIQTSTGVKILIDGGEENGLALAYLQKHGVTSLDAVIATHPHSDHIGGLVDVINNIPVKKIYTNGESYISPAFEDFVKAVNRSHADYAEVKKGDEIVIGNLVFSILHPEIIDPENVNENSLVMRLVYGNRSFLFMGDAGSDSEYALLHLKVDIRSDVIKIGHHGSNSSSSLVFLKSVKPSIAVYMAALNNDYHYPHPSIVKRYASLEIQVYGTDKNGTVTITTDGTDLQIQTEK